jgi:hypothetical protein
MRLIAFHISGQHYKNEEYLKQAKISSYDPGEKAIESNTIHILINGYVTVIRREILL